MSWSYSGDPSTSALDSVRFLIFDTDTAAQLLSNEEINYLLSQESNNVYAASAHAAMQLSAKFGRRGSKSVGDLSIDYDQQATFYRDLSVALRRERAMRVGTGAAIFTAQSIDDKQAREDDTDRVKPKFARNNGPGENGSDDDYCSE